MLIWILMSVGLVVLVAGGFVGRARRERYGSARNGGTHAATHHGKKERHSRGRGRH